MLIIVVDVRSVLRQTHEAFELIVVDDASSDDTAARATAFSDARASLITLGVRHGIAGARNHALEVARGSHRRLSRRRRRVPADRLQIEIGLL